ncbi:M20/M25/M40 family metallo-hydrolase [Nitrosomonas sp.]|uniref:M20/M25/M40 family metallo-hydrolase n=1 Tax=Nitrosomonas sp. TaxID=42353 RepID=UPI0028454CF7|nr:M20/M25/M40 family metallo-hydrolase [Nitrosomonas sp.]MDR4515156.1 M20/M25/M40 family metallo-hydrolase [Nitrosomonas sp.]
MKVAVIFNKRKKNEGEGVINVFGSQNQETYNPATVERVAAALEQGGHNVRIIDGNIHVIEQLQEFMPRVVQGDQPGMVFNMAYGIQGVSRYTHIPSLLEMLGIPYVGSSPAGHGIALDKVTTKVMIQAAGLPTAPYWVFHNADQIQGDLPFPVITKPKMEAVSLGIQVIHDMNSLRTAISGLIDQFKQPVLVEQFIPGREFAVGVLGNQNPDIFPIVEIDLEGDPFGIQSLEDKLRKPKNKICPAQIDDKLANELRRLTLETFKVLGIFDFCRVDFRMDQDGNLYILELNSMASLGLTGTYVCAAKTAGYTYESLINRMLDVAVERYFGKEFEDVKSDHEHPVETPKKDPLRIRLRSYLRSNIDTMEDYLSKMVDINSFIENVEGVNTLGRWVSSQLSGSGFDRQVFSMSEFGNILYFTNHAGETNDVLIVGNLDNPVDYEDYIPFSEERGRIYGTGVARGKGGVAVLLGALKALRYTRALKRVKVGLLFITDDSKGGVASRKIMHELSSKSNYVLGLSGSGLGGDIVTASLGSTCFNVEINRKLGRTSSQYFSDEHDPILYCAQKITQLKKLNSVEQGVYVTLTGLETRSNADLPAYHAALSFVLHFQNPEQSKKLDGQVMRIFAPKMQDAIRVHITKGAQRKPFLQNDKTVQFYDQIAKIAKVVEVRVVQEETGIASLLANVSPGVAAVDGMGPRTGGYGSRDKYVVRDSMIDRSVLLAYLIYKIGRNFA